MAKARRRAGKRALAAGRDRPRARKPGSQEASGSGSRKTKPAKSAAPRQKASVASEAASLKRQLKAARLQTRDALERQTATADILKVIARSPSDVQPVFEAIAANALRLCNAKWSGVVLYDGETIELAALRSLKDSGDAEALRRRAHASFPRKPNLTGATDRAISTKTICYIPDVVHAPGYQNSALVQFSRSVLSVPLLNDGQAVGAITVVAGAPNAFTKRQKELLQTFASQAVIAIENARLFNETQEALERQTATADVLNAIGRSPTDAVPVFDLIGERAEKLCNAEISVVSVLEGDLIKLAGIRGISTEGVDLFRAQFPLRLDRQTLTSRAISAGTIVHVGDVLADPTYDNKRLASQTGYRNCLAVPMHSKGQVVGAIFVARAEPGLFSDNQIQLLQIFADQAVIAIENVRLFNETQEALERQTATSEVLAVISSSPGDLQPVFKAMLNNALRICQAKFGQLLLFDGTGFLAADLHNSPAEYGNLFREGPLVPGSNTALGRLIANKTAAHIHDVVSGSLYAERDPLRIATVDILQARTLLAVPMLKDAELVGAIIIYRQEVRAFSDRQIELVTNFAAQGVIALENTRLLKELRGRTDDLTESLQQQTATAEVLEVISRSAFNLQAVFDTVVEHSVKLCGADRAIIFRYDGELLRIVSAFNTAPEFREWIEQNPIHLGRHSGAARAALERRTIHIPDVLADPEYVYGAKNVEAIRTILGVPILKGDNLLGVIMIFRLEVNPFSEKQIALVETFADQAAIAIENTRLFDEVQARTDDLQESLQQQTATSEVLKVISRSTFDLRVVLQTLVESAAKLSDADKATITRQRDGVFYRAESYGFSDDFMNYVRTVPIVPDRSSATSRALLEGAIVHIPDVQADTEYTFNEAQRLGNFRCILAVPMLREGNPVGVIVLTRTEPRAFTEKQIEVVATFADQAAIAIENVRLFESVEARTRQLQESLEDLRTAQDRLVQTEKLASLGQLTAGIAHEIKNPLNFVNNFSALSAELIDEMMEVFSDINLGNSKREELDEMAQMLKANLEKVVQHGKRADSIVKNMLQHSREGSGERRSAEINALVGESLNLAYHGARAEKSGFEITLKHDLDPNAGAVELYPQEITRALLNLISNGFYAATRRKAENGDGAFEPVLSAATRNLGEVVEIRIRDNGSGIPPEVREKMFNPFFTTKPTGEGTGLGLSMTHDIIVKQHGGRIDVETEPGTFTEFIISLPRSNGTAGSSKPE